MGDLAATYVSTPGVDNEEPRTAMANLTRETVYIPRRSRAHGHVAKQARVGLARRRVSPSGAHANTCPGADDDDRRRPNERSGESISI